MKSILVATTIALSLLLFAGGPPSKGTKKDKRLKENKPPAPPTPKT
jgi:hypothetical protein